MTAVALVITALTGLVSVVRNGRRLDAVETSVNGHTSALTGEIKALKSQLGVPDESLVPADVERPPPADGQ